MKSRKRTRRSKERDLKDLEGHRLALWRLANVPDQQISGLSEEEIILHLCALYLLADNIVASASTYFESKETRRVTHRLRALFEEGAVLYFVDDEMETFLDHGMEKKKKSPADMICYHDTKTLDRRAAELASLGHLLRRPARSISEEIVTLWCEDLSSSVMGSLGSILTQLFPNEDERMEWTAHLLALARDRTGDFVWQYVEPLLVARAAPPRLLSASRRRLALFYGQATARVLGLTSGSAAPNAVTRWLDSGLFLECLRSLRVLDYFARLSVGDLIALKHAPEWLGFRLFYLSLIDSGVSEKQLSDNVELLARMEKRMLVEPQVSRDQILEVFSELQSGIAGRIRTDAKPLRVLLSLFNLFEGGVIAAFRARIVQPQPPENPASGRWVTTIQRRTVVNVDLVGYSTILRGLEQSLGQKAAMQLNDQIQGFILQALNRTGLDAESILALTGDGAIIGFLRTVDAQNFIRHLHAACKHHNVERSEVSAKRAFRAGAATGDIAFARGRNRSLKVAGDAIVRSVRLQAACKPGECLVDEQTLKSLPRSGRSQYSDAFEVPGKRDELFVAHRRIFDAKPASSTSRESGERTTRRSTTLSSAKTPTELQRELIVRSRGVPPEHVDLLMILLDMPFELRPPNTISVLDRMNRLIEWCGVSGKLGDLADELARLAEHYSGT
jgi:class 3 adenylate cyclase